MSQRHYHNHHITLPSLTHNHSNWTAAKKKEEWQFCATTEGRRKWKRVAKLKDWKPAVLLLNWWIGLGVMFVCVRAWRECVCLFVYFLWGWTEGNCVAVVNLTELVVGTRGLIYKTVRTIHTKSVRMSKCLKWRTAIFVVQQSDL